MRVVVPIGKPSPYGMQQSDYGRTWLFLPPWDGAVEGRVAPGPDGHFDHLEPGSLGFAQAHAFGCARFVLDVWESYLGEPVPWHFGLDYSRLEISIRFGFNNATAGYGFLELGEDDSTGRPFAFALSFDTIAHEIGHLLLYGLIGVPDAGVEDGEYQGFQEAAADLTALLGAAHFEPVLDDLFADTHGNLYALNELSRIAELSSTTQIRIASNATRLRDFAGGWSDEHALSMPLTGAVFDVLVGIYHELLIEHGLIDRRLDRLSEAAAVDPALLPGVQAAFDHVYSQAPMAVRAALLEARDWLGTYLAAAYGRLDASRLDYARVGDALIEVDEMATGGRFARLIFECFAWRDIGAVRVGPRLSKPDASSHLHSARTLCPGCGQLEARRDSFRERLAFVQPARARRQRVPLRGAAGGGPAWH